MDIGAVPTREGNAGCVPDSKPRRLNRLRQGDGRVPWMYPETMALHAPWAAYLENFVFVDVGELEVGVTNLRTGRSRQCFVSKWASAGWGWLSMSGLVVNGSGSAAWIGVHEERSGLVREVVACAGDVVERLDSGPGIALDSLHLRGSVLSWTNAGSPHSALLK